MSSANIGWLFYKDYFNGVNYKNLDDTKNEDMIEKKVSNIINQNIMIDENEEILGNIHIKASTIYPGLLLGSGNAHELPSIKSQAILGFHFDYTTGLPVIQGSSIKGVLRSAFKHKEYIRDLLSSKDIDVDKLEKEIFDNSDIFFDAVVINNGKILSDDYLTPHGEDKLKNPIPLRFIKVMPDVSFRFDFQLYDGLISKDRKRKLFETILEDLGLGAKTNVGYGKFENFSAFKTNEEKELEIKLQEQKREADAKEKEEQQKRLKEQKVKKAEDGINTLLDCKTLADGFKLLKDSLGKVPKPTSEQKEVIQQYFNKQKNLSKSEKKTFKKYGIN